MTTALPNSGTGLNRSRCLTPGCVSLGAGRPGINVGEQAILRAGAAENTSGFRFWVPNLAVPTSGDAVNTSCMRLELQLNRGGR